jgi:hypothetical protein
MIASKFRPGCSRQSQNRAAVAQYVAKVRGGFTPAVRAAVFKRFHRLETKTCPFNYLERTAANHLRHPMLQDCPSPKDKKLLYARRSKSHNAIVTHIARELLDRLRTVMDYR